MTKEDVIKSFPLDPAPNLFWIIGSIGSFSVIILMILYLLRVLSRYRTKSLFKETYFWILITVGVVSINVAGIGMIQSGVKESEIQLSRTNWTEHVFMPYVLNTELTKIAIKDYELYGSSGNLKVLLSNNEEYNAGLSSELQFYESKDRDEKGYVMLRKLDLSDFPNESNVNEFWLPEVVSVHLAYVPSDTVVAN